MTNSPDRSGLLPLSFGAVFLLASNVMGHGLYIKPDPRGALLLAAAGLLFFVVAHDRTQQWRERFIRVLQFVLALSTFSLVAALFVADLREFHRMATEDWGAVPPPQLFFSVSYVLASLVALLGCVNARHQPAVSVSE